jgi:hypothetical protein
MKLKQFPCVCAAIFFLAFSLIAPLTSPVSADCNSEYKEVDLGYLAAHLRDFCGEKVRTVGTVNYLASFYMYEDFWLSKLIPIVIRFAGLPKPPENSSIEVCGIIEYCELEGGFFYLNAQSWTYAKETVPEFPSSLILSLFMVAMFPIIIFFKKNLPSKSIDVELI